MDARSAEVLVELNRRFYEQNAQSFSRTRQLPWPGWERVLQEVGTPGSVLDLAAGNLRFQRFVNESFPHAGITHYCVDACEAFGEPVEQVVQQNLDIAHAALIPGRLLVSLTAPVCDLCTSFGFMHHLPGQHARAELLGALIAKSRAHVAVSFWRFAEEEARAAKACKTTSEGLALLAGKGHAPGLDAGDYLLGWNGVPGVYRYCHSFTDAEIDELVELSAPAARLVARYRSDGKGGRSNEYLVLERK